MDRALRRDRSHRPLSGPLLPRQGKTLNQAPTLTPTDNSLEALPRADPVCPPAQGQDLLRGLPGGSLVLPPAGPAESFQEVAGVQVF